MAQNVILVSGGKKSSCGQSVGDYLEHEEMGEVYEGTAVYTNSSLGGENTQEIQGPIEKGIRSASLFFN